MLDTLTMAAMAAALLGVARLTVALRLRSADLALAANVVTVGVLTMSLGIGQSAIANLGAMLMAAAAVYVLHVTTAA